ncbi:TonB-dependent receptor [Polymorphobacter multimanifer]|uniref:Outer membrane receptor protein involved in Fe transport n=1 Tax=Polymorphobacter multimanifer TaxID=1070431 RepID=A0A841L2N3_9SPHN|nr:TonB-dependent receptor [Polymorphobacter multimanifer]MBB6227079.1 outer membrane receptor protein involved in Fe transport [Polymorphobacter multimanifer]GGI70675.1 TonB-dependent receptor [Polymorphobacter multimanifer]
MFRIRSLLLLTSTLGVAALPASVAAQTAEQVADQDIVVTASRVNRSADDTSLSTTTVDMQQLSGFGRTSIGDQLSELPALRETETQQNSGVFGGGGVTGANFLDLRGLGTTRTLVLENGRRHVASQPGTAAVDINLIPLDLIKRVDVVTGGASAIYGSDAVSGVVNFVLDDKFIGVRARAQAGISDKGDASNRLAALTFGRVFAGGRGRIVGSIDYEDREPLFNADRSFARFGSGYFTNPADPGDGNARSNGVPDQILVNDTRIIDSSTGGTVVNPAFDFVTIQPNSILRFAPDGSLNPANLGRGPVGSGFFTEGGDGTNIRESLDLLPKLRRYGAFALASFEVSPAFEIYGEGKYVSIKSESQGAPAFNCDVCGSGAAGPLTISTANPYLTAQARSVLQSIGLVDSFTLNLDAEALGDARERTRREVARGVGGVRGILSDHLRYDLSFTYGRSRILIDKLNNRNLQRFQNSVDAVVDATGVLGARGAIVCRSRLDAGGRATGNADIDACVPVNLFGRRGIEAASTFIGQTTTSRLVLEQQVANGFFSGDTGGFFNLPGGAISFALGGEYRREISDFTADPLESAGLVFNASGGDQGGRFNVGEAFAEVVAPLVRNVRFVDALTLEGSYRVARYSQGGVGTVDSWRVGGLYRPVRDLTFRAAFSRAVRAPNIAELFAPIQGAQFFLSNGDPCSAENINGGSSSRPGNCRALGIPTGFVAVVPSVSSIGGVTGGNPDLRAERSRSITAGATFEPGFAPGFRLSANYYDIRINNAVRALDADTVVSQCVDGPSLAPEFCDLVNRSSIVSHSVV